MTNMYLKLVSATLLAGCILQPPPLVQTRNDVNISILSASIISNKDEISFTVRTSNSGSDDYCELVETVGVKNYPEPYFFFSGENVPQALSNFFGPQFSESPLEPQHYEFIRYPAGTEKVGEYRYWSDYLPENRKELFDLHVKAGRVLVPCSQLAAAGIGEKFSIAEKTITLKVRKIYENGADQLILSQAVPLRPK